ncbi:PREDICTED: peptidyl-prolyl cis-trans isomerase-like 6 [Gekko japonicus]|uniref:Peptidyl-prolyl cis-trans isomerase-like 6 n=1 Tax=Gekko japonicus TaxID=146911 RepID=A0ABM1KEE7_GEKJA|nr:PREDICTED: peptidyl-prolyl cis-trans isomerase-like 6 [Gekko japonicus]
MVNGIVYIPSLARGKNKQSSSQTRRRNPGWAKDAMEPVGLQEIVVAGLLTEPSFHMAVCAAEALKKNFPTKIADPKLFPLLEFAWAEFLQEKKKELRGEVWEYPSNVMCFVDGQLVGDEKMLLKWAYDVWDYKDFKPTALYQAITEDFFTKYMRGKKMSISFRVLIINLCFQNTVKE